jgi:hypothetical protein
LQAAAEEAKALDEVAMHAAMQAAAEAARKAWPSQRQQVKKEPTEQPPDAPNVKQEPTEVRPAPPTKNFGGLGELPRFRVRPGNPAGRYVTSDQIQGAISAVDLTRTPPPQRRGAEALLNAERFGLFHHDAYVVGTIGDSNDEKKADSDDEDVH